MQNVAGYTAHHAVVGRTQLAGRASVAAPRSS